MRGSTSGCTFLFTWFLADPGLGVHGDGSVVLAERSGLSYIFSVFRDRNWDLPVGLVWS